MNTSYNFADFIGLNLDSNPPLKNNSNPLNEKNNADKPPCGEQPKQDDKKTGRQTRK